MIVANLAVGLAELVKDQGIREGEDFYKLEGHLDDGRKYQLTYSVSRSFNKTKTFRIIINADKESKQMGFQSIEHTQTNLLGQFDKISLIDSEKYHCTSISRGRADLPNDLIDKAQECYDRMLEKVSRQILRERIARTGEERRIK